MDDALKAALDAMTARLIDRLDATHAAVGGAADGLRALMHRQSAEKRAAIGQLRAVVIAQWRAPAP
jgi:hypothetical protein